MDPDPSICVIALLQEANKKIILKNGFLIITGTF
jgi:hypothetical protein